MSSRRSFTIKEKAEIISRMKNGENNAALCKEFKVPHSTISSIWKNRDIILECFASRSSQMKKNRKSAHQDVENALLDWAKIKKNEKGILSGPILQEKANYFAKQLGKVDFKCSESWVYRFRQRYGIVFGKVSRETSKESQNNSNSWLTLKLLQDAAESHASGNTAQELKSMLPFNPEMYSDAEPLSNNEADVVINQCCFCGESENDCFDITDMSYVESNKIKLILNDFNIEMDFSIDSTRKSVCRNCDTILNEVNDFVKLVKKTQDKLNNVNQVDDVVRGLLDTQIEGTSLMSCNPSDNDDDENFASEDQKVIINTLEDADRQLEKEIGLTYKRKHHKLKISALTKKCGGPIDLKSSLSSFYNDSDGHKIIDYKDEIDPLAVTDKKSVNKVLSTDEIIGVTNRMMIDNDLPIHVKEEIVEMTDDIAQNDIPLSNAKAKENQFEMNDRASTSDILCKAPSRMNTIVNRRITEETTNESYTVSELTNTSETVDGMSKSDLILLIQSVVHQMLNK